LPQENHPDPRRRAVVLSAGAAAVALALGWPAGHARAAEGQALRVAIEGEYPPFSSTGPGGKLEGFDIDIARALCAEMEASCKLVKQRWDRMIPDLVAGRYEMVVSSMSITASRRRQIDFTDPYYQTPAKFVARAAKKGKGDDDAAAAVLLPASLEALKGKRVAVQKATVHDQYLTARLGGSAQVARYDTLGKAAADLEKGKVDLLFGDAMALHSGLLATAKGKRYAFVGPDLRDRRFFGEGIGIAVRKGNVDLRQRLNAALAKIRADGTYQAIAGRYFTFGMAEAPPPP
jgi:lysine-arginine-ornithine-binding protein